MALGEEDRQAIRNAMARGYGVRANTTTASQLINSGERIYASGNSIPGIAPFIGDSSTLVSQSNPDFIYPGNTVRTNTGRRYSARRGYLRRLTEFYAKLDNPPSIGNRRVNFQFNPDTIVRNVAANTYDTQFFFNQDPSQLTVPIPGQASYSLKLMFNREAELASGKYMSGGRLVKADVRSFLEAFTDNENYFIETEYNPAWVCSLGILADLMMFDMVVGQGFNREMADLVTKTLNNTAEVADTGADAGADEQDQGKESSSTITPWSDALINPNLGNTAFLTPVPVRLQLANWMMIEGFVQQTTVIFHKFTNTYVPSQATVEFSMQALYMGFAKKTTMLTQKIPPADGAGAEPDTPTPTEQNKVVLDETLKGLDGFFASDADDNDMTGDSIKDLIFNNTTNVFEQTFRVHESVSGGKFRQKFTNSADNGGSGGEVKITCEGIIKLSWNSWYKDTSNNRENTVISRSGGTLVKYSSEQFPSNLSSLSGWGTPDNPLIIRAEADEMHVVDPNMARGEWEANLKFMFQRPTTTVPFNDDKFDVELVLRFTAQRYDSVYPINQVVTKKWTVLAVDADPLFKGISCTKRDWPNGKEWVP